MNFQLTFNVPVGLVFFTYTTVCNIVFLYLATRWPGLMTVWTAKEKRFLHYPYKAFGSKLSLKIKVTAIAVIVLAATGEVDARTTSIMISNRCRTFSVPLERRLQSLRDRAPVQLDHRGSCELLSREQFLVYFQASQVQPSAGFDGRNLERKLQS